MAEPVSNKDSDCAWIEKPFTKLLQGLAELREAGKENGKWGLILDLQGNVGTFAKYKAQHLPIFDDITKGTATKGEKFDQEAMTKKIFASIPSGGFVVFDMAEFGRTKINEKDFDPSVYLNTEAFQNIDNCNTFTEYDNLVDVGKKYPDLVVSNIGENKVLYTQKDDPVYFIFCMKTTKETMEKEGKVPAWAEGKFNVLQVS